MANGNGGKREGAGAKPKYGTSLNRVMRVPELWVEPLKTALMNRENPFQSSNNLTPQIVTILEKYKKQFLTVRGLAPNFANKQYFKLVNNLISEIEQTISH